MNFSWATVLRMRRDGVCVGSRQVRVGEKQDRVTGGANETQKQQGLHGQILRPYASLYTASPAPGTLNQHVFDFKVNV